MKKFLFAVAVVCLFAASTPAADEPPVTTTAPAPTVVTSGTTVYSTTPATSTRRLGLFSRLRNRGSNAAYSTMPATVMTPATPMPGTIVPTPMPKTGGTSGVVTSGGTTTVDGKVVETMVMPITTTSTTRSGRMGLFGRLRNRSSGYTTMPATVMTPATPMPKPMTGATTGGTGVVTAGGTTVVEGMAVETVVMPMATTTTRTGRIGLIERMRMRRGY